MVTGCDCDLAIETRIVLFAAQTACSIATPEVIDAMTKQNHMYDLGTTRHKPAEGCARAPLRIAIRLWGYDIPDAQSWIGDLSTLNGLLDWTLALTQREPGADILVHMIKPSRIMGAGFCWNCVGANRSIARIQSAGGTALALFAGHANQLPPTRSGQWVTAGSLSPRAALFRLAHLIAAATTPMPSGTVIVRNHVLEMIARELDVA
jgi:hypothetical protein